MAKKKAAAEPIAPEYKGRPINVGENATFIAAFQLGAGDDIGVISVSNYNDKKALDIRRYYLKDEDETYRPTTKGIRIPEAQVSRLLESLEPGRIKEALA